MNVPCLENNAYFLLGTKLSIKSKSFNCYSDYQYPYLTFAPFDLSFSEGAVLELNCVEWIVNFFF